MARLSSVGIAATVVSTTATTSSAFDGLLLFLSEHFSYDFQIFDFHNIVFLKVKK